VTGVLEAVREMHLEFGVKRPDLEPVEGPEGCVCFGQRAVDGEAPDHGAFPVSTWKRGHVGSEEQANMTQGRLTHSPGGELVVEKLLRRKAVEAGDIGVQGGNGGDILGTPDWRVRIDTECENTRRFVGADERGKAAGLRRLGLLS